MPLGEVNVFKVASDAASSKLKKDEAASKTVFHKFMDSVCDAVNAQEFNTWFSKVTGCAEDGKIILNAPNRFALGCIKSKYSDTLVSLAAEMQMGLELSDRVASAGEAYINDNRPIVSAASSVREEIDGCSFDNFITSPGNEFAVAACKKISAGAVKFSPLFLHGASGSGKTHLMRAVRNGIIEKGGRDVVMLSADRFVSDFLRSLKNGSAFAFKDKILSADVLIIDGIHALAGKRACTAEFESLLAGVVENGGNVLLTSELAPGALVDFPRRLQSLLSSGIVADLSLPEREAKIAILKVAGAADDVAGFIADNSDDNGHVISGIAKKLSVWKEAFGNDMTMQEASRALSDSLRAKNAPEDFVKKMCDALAVPMDDILSARRHARVVRARQMMMAVLKIDTNLSLAEIGRVLGGKDHATVIYGIASIEKQKSCDLTMTAEIEMLRAACKG
ncbi:MAG: DnaA/Hda family protein [Alphaproteobacteria bacterium]|nr:DnaA/Hda family protein [Alphaproteobacteria bacterium]